MRVPAFSNSLRAVSLGALLCASAPGAWAISAKHPFLSLEVIVDVPASDAEKSLGTLRSYLNTLKHAGRTCEAEPYARGVNMTCRVDGDEPILIDFATEPTRYPDRLRVDSIRPKGRNGEELPVSEHADFMESFLRRSK